MATVTPAVTTPINDKIWAASNSVNAPTTPYSGTFIPTFWSGKLAEKFYATTVFGEIANTNWYGEISNVGDTVIINTIPTLTIKEYKVGMQLEYEVPQGETFEIKVDKGHYFAFNVNDVMKLQSKPNLMSMFTDDATMQMKIKVDTLGLYNIFFNATGGWLTRTGTGNVYDACWEKNRGATAGAISASYNMGTDDTPVALTADNILSQITAAATVLDEANVPADGRYMVITPYEHNLLMNSKLVAADFMGDSTSALRNGRIGQIAGFTFYVSNLLPRADAAKAWDNTTASASAKKRHLIFAGHRSGISFASQFTKMEHLRNPTDFGELVRGLNIWGMKVTQGQCLVPIVVGS